ncbi:MgtC/SapB family protein [Enterovibrio makurazakiensis]|uniref:MgtC/SapB family protein n=1 Tax=Enterovibrio makurazakiensis TaxID=2910232 RepID=UPI003D2626E7
MFGYDWQGVWTCAACGWVLGLERQLRGKPVGIRTAILIVLGTYVFMRLATSLSDNSLDHARVLGQIVTGVGFLGAGVMMARDGQVQGVTSAAVVWLMAGLGMIIAFDYGRQALLLCGFVLFILVGLDKVESTFSALRRGVHKKWESTRRKSQKSPSQAE